MKPWKGFAQVISISVVLPKKDDVWRPSEEGPQSAFARADRALAFLIERPGRLVVRNNDTPLSNKNYLL